MKIKKVLMMFTALILSVCLLAGCAPGFVNPGDNLGGGGTVSSAPQESSSEYSSEISAAVRRTPLLPRRPRYRRARHESRARIWTGMANIKYPSRAIITLPASLREKSTSEAAE